MVKEKIENEEICKLIESCWEDDIDLRPDFNKILMKLKTIKKKSLI